MDDVEPGWSYWEAQRRNEAAALAYNPFDATASTSPAETIHRLWREDSAVNLTWASSALREVLVDRPQVDAHELPLGESGAHHVAGDERVGRDDRLNAAGREGRRRLPPSDRSQDEAPGSRPPGLSPSSRSPPGPRLWLCRQRSGNSSSAIASSPPHGPSARMTVRGERPGHRYFAPTTAHTYTSSVSTSVISPAAAAARTSSSDRNWCGANPALKTIRT